VAEDDEGARLHAARLVAFSQPTTDSVAQDPAAVFTTGASSVAETAADAWTLAAITGVHRALRRARQSSALSKVAEAEPSSSGIVDLGVRSVRIRLLANCGA